MNFTTAWSTNAVSVCHSCGLKMISRIERSRRYLLLLDGPSTMSHELRASFLSLVHDRMTECPYPEPLTTFETGIKPEPVRMVPLREQGRQALVEINRKMGLGLDDWDLDYYTNLFVNDIKRDPTNVECFDLSQSNSEHSRHWFFRGRLVIDGKEITETLMKIVKSTYEANRNNSVIAFSDNSSAIRGYGITTLVPKKPSGPSAFTESKRTYNIIFTAETHNFPSGVAPFPGAETGTGGRIRDVQATGTAGLVVAGTAFGRFPAMSLRNTPLLRDVLLPGQSLPGWTFEHFRYILFDSEFLLWLRNSLLVSAGTTAIGLFLALTGAYAFSRFQFRGKRASMLSFIVVQMFPGAIILIPYYVLFYQLGLINSHLGLVVAYSVTALPFVVWFLKGFFDTIPVDLEEAAMVDGTTQIGAFWRVIVPLAKPAIAVAALFTFLSAWNEWLLAFTFMTSSDNYTLPVGVSAFVNPPQVFWNEFAAISLLVSLPVVVLFIVFQKYLVSGLTKGAVKG